MAVAPTFVADMTKLKAALRLTQTVQTDALAIIDAAVLEVRVGFYDALGASRITEIKATTYTDTATTDAEVLRTKANVVEQKWVRMLLLRRLPTFFIESTGGARQEWNEEGLLRDNQRRLEAEINALQSEVQEGIEDLVGGNQPGGGVSASVIGPDEANGAPGARIFS